MPSESQKNEGVGIPYAVTKLDVDTPDELKESEGKLLQDLLEAKPLAPEKFLGSYLRLLNLGIGSVVHEDIEHGKGQMWEDVNSLLNFALYRPFNKVQKRGEVIKRPSLLFPVRRRVQAQLESTKPRAARLFPVRRRSRTQEQNKKVTATLTDFILREANSLPTWKVGIAETESNETKEPTSGLKDETPKELEESQNNVSSPENKKAEKLRPATSRIIFTETNKGAYDEELLAVIGTSKFLGGALTLLGLQTARYFRKSAEGSFLHIREKDWQSDDMAEFSSQLLPYFYAVHNQDYGTLYEKQKELFNRKDFVRKILILLQKAQEVKQGQAEYPGMFYYLWTPFSGDKKPEIHNREIVDPTIFLLRMLGRYVIWQYIQQYSKKIDSRPNREQDVVGLSSLEWPTELLKASSKFLRLARNSVMWGLAHWAGSGIVESPRRFIPEAPLSTALRKEDLTNVNQLFGKLVEVLGDSLYTVVGSNGEKIWQRPFEQYQEMWRIKACKKSEASDCKELLKREEQYKKQAKRILLLALLGKIRIVFDPSPTLREEDAKWEASGLQKFWNERLEDLRGQLATLVPYVVGDLIFKSEDGIEMPQRRVKYWGLRTRPDRLVYPKWLDGLVSHGGEGVVVNALSEAPGRAVARRSPSEGWLQYLAQRLIRAPAIMGTAAKKISPAKIVLEEYKVHTNGEEFRLQDYIYLQKKRLFLLVLTLYSLDRKKGDTFNEWLERSDNILGRLEKVGFLFKLRLLNVNLKYMPGRTKPVIGNTLHDSTFSPNELRRLAREVILHLYRDVFPIKDNLENNGEGPYNS